MSMPVFEAHLGHSPAQFLDAYRRGDYSPKLNFISHKDNPVKHLEYCREVVTVHNQMEQDLKKSADITDAQHQRIYEYVWREFSSAGMEEIINQYYKLTALVKV